MDRLEEHSLWTVLERAVKGRDARAFTGCVELVGGFVGADAGLLVVEPAERHWLDSLLGQGSGLSGDAALEPLLVPLRPLDRVVEVEDLAEQPALRAVRGASPVRALIAHPLIGIEGQRLGELVLAHHQPHTFTREERALVQAAATFLERHLEVVLLSIRCAVVARLPTPEGGARTTSADKAPIATDLLVHDLKNPLAVIMLTAESARASEDPRVPELMDDILESVGIAQRLVHDMLDVRTGAAPLQMARERIDLRALAARLISRVSVVAARRHQTLTLECPAQTAMVEGDPFLLERLLRNLLDNAFKYAPPSSAITVVIAEREASWLLRVEDQGRPIAPAIRAAIFEQDTRLVTSTRGSHGLGLKLCRAVAELHDARLSVETSSSGGNAFALELKRASS